MGRVYFPTKNDMGKRTLSGVTLGSDYAGFRAPAEPGPRSVSTLVTLGMISLPGGLMVPEYGDPGGPGYGAVITPTPVSTLMPAKVGQPAAPPTYWGGSPIIARPIYNIGSPVAAPQSVAQPKPGPVPIAPAAPPVSQQTTPTPTVTIPAAPSTGAVLVSSGGGTASPAVAPADSSAAAPAAAPTDVTGQIAAWLSGSTAIFSYNVPNALLAAAVILGFAWLEGGSSSGKKR